MGRNVKNPRVRPAAGRKPVAKTRISSKHQVTIAKQAFDEAGFRAGETVAVRALGPGRVELASLDALFAKYRGSLSTGGEFRRIVEEARDEWD
jgi:hypothetical protein